MKIKYEASDGSLFETAEECVAYENNDKMIRKKIAANVVFYNERGNFTFINPNRCEDESDFRELYNKLFEHATKIRIRRDFDEETRKYASEIGIIILAHEGYYFYDEVSWVSFDDALERFKNAWPMFEISAKLR